MTEQEITEMQAAWDKIIEALNALAEIIVKFVKTFCNTILLFGLTVMRPEVKRVLKLNVYHPILRRKVALRSLTHSLNDHSNS